ncbi:MAG: methyltransferase domain-containing protein [Deltaproteobacteria bacterium]|nr:methyltransferase domain-containing protein [Deltaproteobacteria bacterium]
MGIMTEAIKQNISAIANKEQDIYAARFSAEENKTRAITWEVLTQNLLQRYISIEATVLDVASGEGLFLKNIKAKRRIAVDVNPQVSDLSELGIETFNISALAIDGTFPLQIDIIMVSNFLEHLENKGQVIALLRAAYQALKPGGRIIILQPNIRFVKEAYWDYIDHHIALTDKSLAEAVSICNFEIERLVPRFLPYTARSTSVSILPERLLAFAVKVYINCPLAWYIFGAQTLLIAKKK